MKVGDLVTKIVHPKRQLYGLIIETCAGLGAEPDQPVTSVKVAWTGYGTFWQPVNAGRARRGRDPAEKIEVINESR